MRFPGEPLVIIHIYSIVPATGTIPLTLTSEDAAAGLGGAWPNKVRG